MEFRPCIDIHNGMVKQIVGSSLKDEKDQAQENFVSPRDSRYYADIYRQAGLKGGHIVLLNQKDSPYYKKTRAQAFLALKAYPQGFQIGGGIDDENAGEFLSAGAAQVIVTSFAFADGILSRERLERLLEAVGKDRIVLDLSCRKKEGQYHVVTNRWQTFTQTVVDEGLLEELSPYCCEYLIHGVDVEGKNQGIEEELLHMLSRYAGPCPVTYAGGISTVEDILKIKDLGSNRINVTVGSALDLFGGSLPLLQVLFICRS